MSDEPAKTQPDDDFQVIDIRRLLKVMGVALLVMAVVAGILVAIAAWLGRFG